MELRHLRYFVAVAEEENVSRAALRLRISQPAVSRQIADLEDEMSVRLFHRSAKSLRLTAAGHVFFREARAVLERAREAVRTAQDAAADPPETLHIGYAPSPTVEILAWALRAFQEAHPAIRVALHDMNSCEMFAGLRGGEIHAALMVRPESADAKGIHFETLKTYPTGIAVSSSHPFAGRRWVGLAEIVDKPLIFYSLADYPDYAAWACQLLGRKQSDLNVALECDGAVSLIAAVESGRGIALAAKSLLLMAGKRIRFVPLRPSPDPLAVGVGHLSKTPSTGVARFVEIARRIAGPPKA
ncbi:MAG: LysR substrate-binding domain-containing protein [Terrimicrobiaceae bacterium]|nr:LysR substrate-binding domain-containing protein [Terrimicrobiaceae bacterium]